MKMKSRGCLHFGISAAKTRFWPASASKNVLNIPQRVRFRAFSFGFLPSASCFGSAHWAHDFSGSCPQSVSAQKRIFSLETKMRTAPRKILLLAALLIELTFQHTVIAEEKSKAAEPAASAPSAGSGASTPQTPAKEGPQLEVPQPGSPAASGAERLNVENIKEKYWARGDESELGVVQNRLYSKARKFEVGLFGGVNSTDPFLSVKTAGGTVGFHFNEYFSFHVLGYKDYVAPSAALLTFQENRGATTNFNAPQYFIGGEGSASVLYGKLSLIGKAIIYYDFHFLGGGGVTATETGKYPTPYLGVGQQIYLSKWMSLRIDYRLFGYRENIVEKVVTPKLGEIVGQRVNWSNVITLGIDILFGVTK